jgi:hypothetical protein
VLLPEVSARSFPPLMVQFGGSNSFTGKFSCADAINAENTIDGIVPPATDPKPLTLYIGISASGAPTQTPVDRYGVNPTNQASR